MTTDNYDFSKLLIPVHQFKINDDIDNAYPYLLKHDILLETWASVHIDYIIKFSAYVYDRNSPLVKEYPDMRKRRVAAAELAEFEKDKNGHFTKPFEDIIIYKNQNANIVGVYYCRLQNSKLWSALCALQDQFYQELENLGKEDKSRDRKIVFDMISDYNKRFKDLDSDMLTGDTETVMREKLYEEMDNEILELRPEDIAYKRMNNIRIGNFNPYE